VQQTANAISYNRSLEIQPLNVEFCGICQNLSYVLTYESIQRLPMPYFYQPLGLSDTQPIVSKQKEVRLFIKAHTEKQLTTNAETDRERERDLWWAVWCWSGETFPDRWGQPTNKSPTHITQSTPLLIHLYAHTDISMIHCQTIST